MRISFSCIALVTFAFALIGQASLAEEPDNPSNYKPAEHRIETGIYLMRDNLYRDDEGTLMFVTLDETRPDRGQQIIFRQRFGVFDAERADTPPARLSDVIDGGSWKRLTDTIYADMDAVYCHYMMVDGGHLLQMEGINPDTLSAIITDADSKTRQVDIESFRQSDLAETERAWYFTDGTTVIGNRCGNYGPLATWTPE